MSILVRTLRGDLFEFPEGTSLLSMKHTVATALDVNLSWVQLCLITVTDSEEDEKSPEEPNGALIQYMVYLQEDRIEYVRCISSDGDRLDQEHLYHVKISTLPSVIELVRHSSRDRPRTWQLHKHMNTCVATPYETPEECIRFHCQWLGYPCPTASIDMLSLYICYTDTMQAIESFRHLPIGQWFQIRREVMEGVQELIRRHPDVKWYDYLDHVWEIESFSTPYEMRSILRRLQTYGLSEQTAWWMVQFGSLWIPHPIAIRQPPDSHPTSSNEKRGVSL